MLLLSGSTLLAQDTVEANMLKKLISELKHEDRDSAFKLIQRGIQEAQKKSDSSDLAYFYLEKGSLHKDESPKLALEYYFKANKIYQSDNNRFGLARASLFMSLIRSLDFEQRIILAKKALTFFEEVHDTIMTIYSYSALGNCFHNNNMQDSGMYYLRRALKLALRTNSPSTQASMYNNIGIISFANAQFNEAGKSYKKALEIALQSQENMDFIYKIRNNLISYYLRVDMLDSALYCYDLIKDIFNVKPADRGNYYYKLSDYYKRNENPRKALLFHEKADSISKAVDKETHANALSFLELEYESQIKEEKLAKMNVEIEKSSNRQFFLMGIILLIFIFSGILFWQQKLKSRKKRELLRSEQKLLAAELENSEMKRQYLDDELKYTNKELTSFATNIVQNHEIIEKLRWRINALGREKKLRDVKRKLKDVNIILKQMDINNEQRKEFVKKSRELNSSLVYYLRSNFSQLTDSDINLLIFILLKFNSKEISILYNIESKSITQRRYRLRKKLGIENRETFESFLARILPDNISINTDTRKI